MNCGCCKDLGCFAYNQVITFPFESLSETEEYTFHIWSNGGYSTISDSFALGTNVSLPFTFNENSETTIKVELPLDFQNPQVGIKWASSEDGACCFTVHGLISQCN